MRTVSRWGILGCLLAILGCSGQPGGDQTMPADTETARGGAVSDASQASVDGADLTEPDDSASSASATADGEPSEPSPLIIDVRTEAEWESGHLSGAVHIPHTEIAERIGEFTTDKTTRIVLYCRSGGRAGRAKEVLEEMGYVDVLNAGGLEDAKRLFGQPGVAAGRAAGP